MNKSGRRTTAEGERLHKAIHPFYMAKHEYNGPAIRDLIEIALATVRAEGHRAGMEKAAGIANAEAPGWNYVTGNPCERIAAAILAAAEDTP